jgi:cytochrome c-type biogenesis protein CcmE
MAAEAALCIVPARVAIGRRGADRELEYGGLLVGGLIKRDMIILEVSFWYLFR